VNKIIAGVSSREGNKPVGLVVQPATTLLTSCEPIVPLLLKGQGIGRLIAKSNAHMREQFSLAAISDHNRADTVAALQKLAVDKHLPVLVAVEMTTVWKDEMSGKNEMSGQDNMTNLCFGFDPPPNAFFDIVQDLLRRQGHPDKKRQDRWDRVTENGS
jgi:hypothetical protein